jgi:4-amino-4-deoxy-L-arabinose transferase-like glycosyltransferase
LAAIISSAPSRVNRRNRKIAHSPYPVFTNENIGIPGISTPIHVAYIALFDTEPDRMGSIAGLAQQGYRVWSHRPRLSIFNRDFRTLDCIAYGGLAVVAMLTLFYGLGGYGIIDGNESLYAESAREMAQTGNWTVPTLNGLPYLEKPPLFIWAIVAANQLLDSIEVAPRLVSACAALLLVLGVARFSVLLGLDRTGRLPAFILLTSLGVSLMSHVAMPDALLTALFAPACLGLLTALRTDRIRHARLAAALLGLAALVKGALALALFALIVAACYVMEAAWRPSIGRFVRDPLSALLVLLPLALWLAAIENALPGAAYHFIVDEHVLRFLGMRMPRDYYGGPLYYYVPRLFAFLFPWSGVLLFGWLVRPASVAPERRQVRRYLWLCVWIPFAFFSVSSAKANYYVILCLPPLALLTAEYLPALLGRHSRGLLVMAGILPLALLVAILAVGMRGTGGGAAALRMPLHAGEWLMIAAAIAAVFALLVKTGRRRAAIACLGGLVLPALHQVHEFVVGAEPLISMRAMATHIIRQGDSPPIFLFEDFEAAGGLPIYLGTTIPVIDSKSNDLQFGASVVGRHPNLVDADSLLRSGREAWVVVLKNRQRDFAGSRLAGHAVEMGTIGRASLYRIHPESTRGLPAT